MTRLVRKGSHLPPAHLKVNTWPMIEINEGTAIATPPPAQEKKIWFLHLWEEDKGIKICAHWHTNVRIWILHPSLLTEKQSHPRDQYGRPAPLRRGQEADSNLNVYSGNGDNWEHTFFRSWTNYFIEGSRQRSHMHKLHDFYLCDSTMKRKGLFITDPHGPWDSHMGVKSFTWTSSFQILQRTSHRDLVLDNLLRQIEKYKDRVAGISEIKGQTVKMHPAPSGEFWTCFVP